MVTTDGLYKFTNALSYCMIAPTVHTLLTDDRQTDGRTTHRSNSLTTKCGMTECCYKLQRASTPYKPWSKCPKNRWEIFWEN